MSYVTYCFFLNYRSYELLFLMILLKIMSLCASTYDRYLYQKHVEENINWLGRKNPLYQRLYLNRIGYISYAFISSYCLIYRPVTTEEQLVGLFDQYGTVAAFKFFEWVKGLLSCNCKSIISIDRFMNIL